MAAFVSTSMEVDANGGYVVDTTPMRCPKGSVCDGLGYSTREQTNVPEGLSGKLSVPLDGGGYVLDSATMLVPKCDMNGWIDGQTRALVHEMSVYNVASGQICLVRITVEFDATGAVGVQPGFEMVDPFSFRNRSFWSSKFEYGMYCWILCWVGAELIEVKACIKEVEFLLPLNFLCCEFEATV